MNYVKENPEEKYGWSKYFRVFEFVSCVFSLAFSIYVLHKSEVNDVVKYAMLVTSIMYSIITAFDLVGYCTDTPISYKFMWIMFALTAFAMFCVVFGLGIYYIVTDFWFHIGIAVFAVAALIFLFDIIYVICKSDSCTQLFGNTRKTESQEYIPKIQPKVNTVHTSVNEDLIRLSPLCPCARANLLKGCKNMSQLQTNQSVPEKEDWHLYFVNKTTQTSRVSTAQKETETTQPRSMNYLSPTSYDSRRFQEIDTYQNRGSFLNVIRRSVSKMVGQKANGKETQTNELGIRTVEACDCTYCDVTSKPNIVVTTKPNNSLETNPRVIVTEPAIHQHSTGVDDSSMFRAVNELENPKNMNQNYSKSSTKPEECCHYTSMMKIWQEAHSPYQVRDEQPEKSMSMTNPDLLRTGDFSSTRVDIPKDNISIIKPRPVPTHRGGEECMSLPSQTVSTSSTPVIEYEEIHGLEHITTHTSTTDLRKHIEHRSCCKENQYVARDGTPPIFTARRSVHSPIYKSILYETRSDTSKT